MNDNERNLIERRRFQIELTVMIATVVAVAASSYQTYLMRQQFVVSELHLAEEREKRRLEDKEERQPVMVPSVGTFMLKYQKDETGRSEITDNVVLTVANIGKAPALNTRCKWECEFRRSWPPQAGVVPLPIQYSICMPGSIVEAEVVPAKMILSCTQGVAEGTVRKYCRGTLFITSVNVDGNLVETQQRFLATQEVEAGEQILLITFEERSFTEDKNEREENDKVSKQTKHVQQQARGGLYA